MAYLLGFLRNRLGAHSGSAWFRSSGNNLPAAIDLLALLAFSTRKYETAPVPEAVIGLMAQGGDAWLKWRFLGNMVVALTINRGKLERKARLLSSAIGLLLIVVLLLGGYLIYLLTARVGG